MTGTGAGPGPDGPRAVTFLLSDVPGTTARWEAAPNETAAALARLDDVVVAAASRHGGTLVKPRGENDSHFLVFDDAASAIAAAVRFGATVAGERLAQVRIAVTTGEAVRRGDDWYGPVVNHCARLRSAAHPGQVVVGQPAVDAAGAALPAGASLADLGWHWLKDLERPLRVHELRHPDLPTGFPPLASLQPPAPDLPVSLSDIVGRGAEVERLGALLAGGARVVSVTGAPGVGKTRVALEAVTAVARSGQVLVSWATAVPPAVAAVRSPMPELVVVDDGDHAHAGIRALLAERRGAPDLTVLVTSRAPLGLPDETVLRLEPLAEPAAVDLLRSRAAAARPGLVLDDDVAVALARLLGGLPLALELAAGRLAVLGPAQLLSRLSDPGRVLTARVATPERHRSIASAIAWTLADLGPTDRVDLARLARAGAVPSHTGERLVAAGWAERGPTGPFVLSVLVPYLSEV